MPKPDPAIRRNFLRDLVCSAAGGIALGAVLSLALALADFPEWGVVTWSFFLSFGLILPVALTFRVIIHVLHWSMERKLTKVNPGREGKAITADDLLWSRFPIIVFAVVAAAYVPLTVAHRVGTGAWSPF